MPLSIMLRYQNLQLSEVEESRLRRQLAGLESRLVHHPDPVAELSLSQLVEPRRIEADLRVRLGPLGSHLVSHQAGATVYSSVRLAIKDVERQLERQHAKQRGEPTFGVPSRRRLTWQKE